MGARTLKVPVAKQVGDVDGRVAAFAYLDGFLEGVEVLIAEQVANVGVVEAAELGELLGKLDEFVGVGIGTGRVVESSGHADGTLLHRLAEDGLLVVHLLFGGLAVVPAHGVDADGRVADDVCDVDGDLAVVGVQVFGDGGPIGGDVGRALESGVHGDKPVEVLLLAEGGVGVAVDAVELGGDALVDFGVVKGVGENHERGVGVDVDEAGSDDAPLRIEHFLGFLFEFGDVATVDGDGVAGDADGGVEAGAGGAVDDHSALNQQVQHGNPPRTGLEAVLYILLPTLSMKCSAVSQIWSASAPA